jgi:hypothetical protein
VGIDLDAGAGAIDLGAPAVADAPAGGTPVAVAAAPEPVNIDAAKVADAIATVVAEAKPEAVKAEEPKPEPKAEPKPDPEDRVIELSRSRREAYRKADEAKRSAKRETEARVALEANVKKLEPVLELLNLSSTDPLAFITEIADVAGLSPERVLQVLQTKGAGGDPAPLSADERIALLERKLEEAKSPKPEPKPEPPKEDPEAAAKAEAARDNFVSTFENILEAAPESYPFASQDADAPQAAFLVLANHWTQNGRQADGSTRPDYKPPTLAQALRAVEQTLSKQSKPSQASPAPQSSKPPPGQPTPAAPTANPSSNAPVSAAQPIQGLSNSTMGAVLPVDSDRILSDAEIKADLMRIFG